MNSSSEDRLDFSKEPILQTLLANVPIGIAYHSMIYDDSGNPVNYYFHDVNDNFIDFFGLDPRGKTATQIFPGINNEPFDWIGTFAQVARTGKAAHIKQNLKYNGSWYDCYAYQYKPDHFAVVLWNITEYKNSEKENLKIEQQLQQVQKHKSMGTLAGGIAHNFNNLLAVIIGNCSLVKLRPESTPTRIQAIEKAAERAAELVRRLLLYTRDAQFTSAPVDMSLLVEDLHQILKSTIKSETDFILDQAVEIPIIDGDASQITQIVMNLISNATEAIDAVPGTIRVTLTTTRIIAGQSECDYFENTIPAGNYVCLEVTDNGGGMDAETKQRIFEPFYTTKFEGRGLGMSAVIGIITGHKGAIQIFSQPKKGTTIKVYLPSQKNEPSDEIPTGQDSQDLPLESGTVLLVEDQEMFILIAKAMLETMGYDVIEALNGEEALVQYQKNAADISLVVTDLDMPVMDGYALIHELQKRAPELPIIISSGFDDTDVISKIPREKIAGLVNKPYNLEQLREVLKKVSNPA